MNNLEESLAEVENLRKMIGHWKLVTIINAPVHPDGYSRSYIGHTHEYHGTDSDKIRKQCKEGAFVQWAFGPPFTKQARDEERAEAVKKAHEISADSEWYSARYAASKLLCRKENLLLEDFKKWMEDSEDKIRIFPLKTRKDLKHLYNLQKAWGIRNCTDGALEKYNENKQYRIMAGKALGYSNMRIWAHEHKKLVAAGIIATAGIAYALLT